MKRMQAIQRERNCDCQHLFGGSEVCEAALGHLCTNALTTVLVSTNNHGRLKRAYEAIAEKQCEHHFEQLYLTKVP